MVVVLSLLAILGGIVALAITFWPVTLFLLACAYKAMAEDCKKMEQEVDAHA